MRIETDLNVIKRNAKIREEENFEFRTFLKFQDPDKVDRIVHELYDEVSEQIDCTECGNCCIELDICFKGNEIDILTNHLNVDKDEFINLSTTVNREEEEERYCLNSKPCQFLENKKCTIYEVRSGECRSYPHLHKDEFTSRLYGVIYNYEICPIVYNVYEQLKRKMSFGDIDSDYNFI